MNSYTFTTSIGWEEFTYVMPGDGPIYPLDYALRNNNATLIVKNMPSGTSTDILLYGYKDEEWHNLTNMLESTSIGGGNSAYQLKNLVGFEKIYACTEGIFSVPKFGTWPTWSILVDPRI